MTSGQRLLAPAPLSSMGMSTRARFLVRPQLLSRVLPLPTGRDIFAVCALLYRKVAVHEMRGIELWFARTCLCGALCGVNEEGGSA